MIKERVDLELRDADWIQENDDGTIEFDLRSTDEWVPPKVLEKIASCSTNLPVYWRHKSPQDPLYKDYLPVGRVVKSWMGDGGIWNRYRIGGPTDLQKNVKDWVLARKREGKPVGASIGTMIMRNGEKDVIDAEPFEYSITPDPDCVICKRETNMGTEKTSDEIKAELDKEKEQIEIAKKELDKEKAELAQKAKQLDELATSIEKHEMTEIERLTRESAEAKKQVEAVKELYDEKFRDLRRQPLLTEYTKIVGENMAKAHLPFLLKQCPDKLETFVAEVREAKGKEPVPSIIVTSEEQEREAATEATVEEILRSAKGLPPAQFKKLEARLKGE